MPRHRFITSLLAVVLLAAGCGGGDDASEEPEGTQADGVSEVATSDTDQPDTTARDSTDQPDAGTEPEPEPEPEPQSVRLGDRFAWCVDTQRDWDRLAEIQGQVDAAEAALRDAQETLEAAADELDRAEALQVFESAERHVADLLPVFVDAAHEVVRSVRSGRRHREETEVIAVERAREAFYAAAAPALVELLGVTDAASSLYEEPVIALEPASEPAAEPLEQPEPAGEALPPEELLRALQELQDEVYNLQLDVSGVRGQVEGAIGDIRRAENPTEALAARAAGREGLQALDEIDSAAREAGRITQELERAYLDSVWRARDAGAISQEEHESARTTWYEAVQGISRLTTFIHDRADRRQLIPLGNAALEEAANAFVLADPAWAVFQMSLSESCQL